MKEVAVRSGRISHLAILEALEGSNQGSRGIVRIYRDEVLPIKTRTLHLLGKKAPAETLKTLLGFEVQAGSKRIQCPDMVTARFLKVFMELGCGSIRLPYDPTVTARLVPELESALERLVKGVERLFPQNHTLQLYVTRRLYRHIRNRLRAV